MSLPISDPLSGPGAPPWFGPHGPPQPPPGAILYDLSAASSGAAGYLYIGYGPKAVASNPASRYWTIRRIALDDSGMPVKEDWTAKNAAIWNNRATETYLS